MFTSWLTGRGRRRAKELKLRREERASRRKGSNKRPSVQFIGITQPVVEALKRENDREILDQVGTKRNNNCGV